MLHAFFHRILYVLQLLIQKCMDISANRALRIRCFMKPEQITAFYRLDRLIYIIEGYL